MPFKPLSYSTKCPQCGGHLQPVALDAQTAPWLCNECHLGFWAVDLSTDARKSWGHRGFVHDAGSQALHARRLQEHQDALVNGTSLREDQIGVAPLGVLQSALLGPNITPAFKALVQTQITNMGPA